MEVRFAGVVFDRERRELARDSRVVPLTPKAFALLEMLVDAAPAPIAKEELYDRLWPAVFVEPGNLHNLISELRAAIGDETHEVIRTAHRFGYALDVAVYQTVRSQFELVIGTEVIPLREGETMIGRDLIDSPDVSRRHARIVIDGEAATIEDLGSKNGTFVHDRRIAALTPLSHGEEVVIGRRRVVVRLSSSGLETSTADPFTESRG
jgi:DNA-binding winged helix-turn-helix (wHTH) protein